jgi:hypothetical protein
MTGQFLQSHSSRHDFAVEIAAHLPKTAQRRQISALPAPGLMRLGAVMPGSGHVIESGPATASHVSPSDLDPLEFFFQRRQKRQQSGALLPER